MKKSIVLFELIISIVLLSIIFTVTSKFIFEVYTKNKQLQNNTILQLEFETTKLFFIRLLENNSTLGDIKYKKSALYFKDDLLLENVDSFKLQKNNTFYNINICIKKDETICQNWIIK